MSNCIFAIWGSNSLSTLLELFLNGIKKVISLFWPSLMRSWAYSEIRCCMWWLRMASKWRGSVCGNYLRLSVWSLSSCNCLDPDQKICKESFSLIHRKSVLKMIYAPCQGLSRCEWDQLLLKQTQVPSLEPPVWLWVLFLLGDMLTGRDSERFDSGTWCNVRVEAEKTEGEPHWNKIFQGVCVRGFIVTDLIKEPSPSITFLCVFTWLPSISNIESQQYSGPSCSFLLGFGLSGN